MPLYIVDKWIRLWKKRLQIRICFQTEKYWISTASPQFGRDERADVTKTIEELKELYGSKIRPPHVGSWDT